MVLAQRDGMAGLSAAEDAYLRVTFRDDPVEVEQTLSRRPTSLTRWRATTTSVTHNQL